MTVTSSPQQNDPVFAGRIDLLYALGRHYLSLPFAVVCVPATLMAGHPMLTRLRADGSGHATELWFEARQPEDLLAPLAHSAAALFATVDRKRVRKCRQCVLHFNDTSKKGTRRWCSMRMCGNRLKVAAYAARRRRK